MFNFDDYVNGIAFNKNKTERNKNWPYIPDHPYKILINLRFRIWKNKSIIEFNRKPTI